jgi:hypothetical protein
MGEMTHDDLTLLQEYARHHSEAAFAALVSRHDISVSEKFSASDFGR